jgi:hypothetical protein
MIKNISDEERRIAKLLREFDEFKIKLIHLDRVVYIEKRNKTIKLIEEDVFKPEIKYEEKIDLEKASNLIYFELKFREKFFKNCYDGDGDEDDEDEDEDDE